MAETRLTPAALKSATEATPEVAQLNAPARLFTRMGLTERLTPSIREGATDRVGRAAKCEAHEEANGLVGIALPLASDSNQQRPSDRTKRGR